MRVVPYRCTRSEKYGNLAIIRRRPHVLEHRRSCSGHVWRETGMSHNREHESYATAEILQAARAVDRETPRGGGAHRRSECLPDALRPPGPHHRGDGVCRQAGGTGCRAYPRRNRCRAPNHPCEHQPSRVGADGDRGGVPLQDQRQHRQLRGHLEHRRGTRQACTPRSASAPIQ